MFFFEILPIDNFLTGTPGVYGAPGVVTEEGLLSMLRRPGTGNVEGVQNDGSSAYDELTNIEQVIDGKKNYTESDARILWDFMKNTCKKFQKASILSCDSKI